MDAGVEMSRRAFRAKKPFQLTQERLFGYVTVIGVFSKTVSEKTSGGDVKIRIGGSRIPPNSFPRIDPQCAEPLLQFDCYICSNRGHDEYASPN
jgi:hypothetical protein